MQNIHLKCCVNGLNWKNNNSGSSPHFAGEVAFSLKIYRLQLFNSDFRFGFGVRIIFELSPPIVLRNS
jgi:hypothetical protein